MRIDEQPHGFVDELVGHFVEAALIGDGAIFAHQALESMLEV